ncbi:SMP-30/gluconolactonase/LRE family protein, partial [Pseudomonas syringae pv. tagetis]|uniref:SMP-30/gluconolactonase/LRE family protein n=1 Tax=Pseudomonas syringae group genomosp. 7 TaxID=251699 RepID=UPI0037706AB3
YNGRITVQADSFDGKTFNSPNDIFCKRDGTIWFTDPTIQANSDYEGRKVKQEQPFWVYRIDPENGKVIRVIDDMAGPN